MKNPNTLCQRPFRTVERARPGTRQRWLPGPGGVNAPHRRWASRAGATSAEKKGKVDKLKTLMICDGVRAQQSLETTEWDMDAAINLLRFGMVEGVNEAENVSMRFAALRASEGNYEMENYEPAAEVGPRLVPWPNDSEERQMTRLDTEQQLSEVHAGEALCNTTGDNTADANLTNADAHDEWDVEAAANYVESGAEGGNGEGACLEDSSTGRLQHLPDQMTRPGAVSVPGTGRQGVSSSYGQSASLDDSSDGRLQHLPDQPPFTAVAELVDEEEQDRLYQASQYLRQAQQQAQAAQQERDQVQLERDALRARLESNYWNKWIQKCQDLSKRQRMFVYLILGGIVATIVTGIVLDVKLLEKEGKSDQVEAPPPAQEPFCLNSSCWIQLGNDIQGSQKGARFGWPVSLATNGTRLAVSAHNDLNGIDAGLVRVFDISNDGRASHVGTDINGERSGDTARGFLSRNGNRLVVGAPKNDGIDGSKAWSGQARVFELESGSWKQVGDSIYGDAQDNLLGRFPALSADGSILAIGAQWHKGMAGMYSGHVRVYEYIGSAWVRLGHDIEGVAEDDEFGSTIALSDDGMVVAASAWYNDKVGADSGHVRVFRYESGDWTQLGGDIHGVAAGDEFGNTIAISSDGKTLAAGAPYNNGNGDSSGHVRVFSYNETDDIWHQVGQDINGDEAGDELSIVALSSNGARVATGAFVADYSGYVRVYDNINDAWQQVGGKIIGRRPGESFGVGVSLSSDGNRLAVGGTAWSEEPPSNGAVRLYDFNKT